MEMFDAIHTELDCPFCSRQYHHTPLTREQAQQEVKDYKQRQIQSRQEYLRGGRKFYLQDFWARRDGFEDIDAWIEQLDSSDKIEAHRTERTLGLAEIQTKEFENVMDHFFVGDEVPKYSGHYFIAEEFKRQGCSAKGEWVYVKVWLEDVTEFYGKTF